MKRTRKPDKPEASDHLALSIEMPVVLSSRVGAYSSSAASLLHDAEGLTFRQALILYEELITPTKKGAREERCVIRVLRTFAVHMLDLKLTEIRPKHIATYRNIRRQSPSIRTYRNGSKVLGQTPKDATIRKELCLVSDVFRKAQLEWGLEGMSNPVVAGVRPKAARGRVRRLLDEERALVFAAAREYEKSEFASVPIYAVVELAVETAMRLGELASMRWQDVDFDRCYVQLQTSKNGEARAVPLKPRAVEILRSLKPKRAGPVFDCESESIRTAWNRVRRRSGIQNFRFHDLRHEAISDLIENADRYGLSLPEVMFVSGHKTLAMVTRYYHALAPRIAKKLAR